LETKNLEKWQSKLDICIRCGYCFEHCHLFKVSGWETDTPRAKLIMLFGILNGEIEPSEYIAEKIFECYLCKRCDTSCSAKVEVTDILMDARLDFIEAGYEVDGTTSKTNDDLCSRCGVCISVCKHEARSLDKENDKIVIDKAKCQSCGCCIAACPSGAAYSNKGYAVSKDEMLEKIYNYLGGN